MLSVIILSFLILSDIMLSFLMLRIFKLSIMAPHKSQRLSHLANINV
jgi:hypothetical protein